jgi:hypothetical protein
MKASGGGDKYCPNLGEGEERCNSEPLRMRALGQSFRNDPACLAEWGGAPSGRFFRSSTVMMKQKPRHFAMRDSLSARPAKRA